MNKTCEETFNTIIELYPSAVILDMLWKLSSDQEIVDNSGNYATHPLGSILSYINRLVPKVSRDTLEQLLNANGSDLIVKV
jgi:hypothetical protein